MIGIWLDGIKEVLGFTIDLTESAYVWKELFQELKDRSLEEVLLDITFLSQSERTSTQQI